MWYVWEQFRQVFLDKYFPVAVWEKKAREFDLFVQTEEMTIYQYEARFSMMSRYAPELVDTPEKRERKYERGLLPNTRTHLTTLMLSDYGEIHRRACELEKFVQECMEWELRESEVREMTKRPRRFVRSAQGGRNQMRGGPFGAPQYPHDE